MKKNLNGNLYSSDFFYYLEKDGEKSFYTKQEIVSAIKKAISENIDNQSDKTSTSPNGDFLLRKKEFNKDYQK